HDFSWLVQLAGQRPHLLTARARLAQHRMRPHVCPSLATAAKLAGVSDPRRLGPYEIVRRLGAGGMAEVHLAHRFGASGWQKTVALKLLRPELRGQPHFERLLISEARLGARFAHPGLVCVHDLGLADAIYYVCMDYVDGRDLA